ncbi:MAG TPA: hypothetical protein VFK89_09555, partial [Actinomycetota bacterium]|nr:hypothetical protein [Actinomycetota bacterium]
MEELFVQVLERFTDRLIERQRALYADDTPFIEKWRAAMDFLETDRVSGYQKIWFEHYGFSGYITGFDPHSLDDVAAIRGELG